MKKMQAQFFFCYWWTKPKSKNLGARTQVKKSIAITKIKEISIEIKNLWLTGIFSSCIKKRVSHYNLGKCTRCKHKIFVLGGWN